MIDRTLDPRTIFRHLATLFTLLLAVVLLGSCGSTGLGDIIGNTEPSDPLVSDVSGTVERVDTARQEIVLVDARTGYQTNLRNEGDDRVVLAYDERTLVEFEGATYRPTDLERGDRVAVRVDQSGNRLLATDVEVTYDVTGGTGAPSDDRWDDDRWDDDDRWSGDLSQIQGTVRTVDTRDRTLTIERGSGWSTENLELAWDDRTRVEYQGRTYEPTSLERGDRVTIEVREVGSTLLASDIEVLESITGTDRYDDDSWVGDDLRGTIVSVDTRNRTLEIDRDTAAWQSDDTVRLYYDQRTTVEFEGRSYSPGNLERGDLVEIDVREVGDQLLASQILVVADARERTSARWE